MRLNALDPRQHSAQNAERVRRIEALLARHCRPAGLHDVTYESYAQHNKPEAVQRGQMKDR